MQMIDLHRHVFYSQQLTLVALTHWTLVAYMYNFQMSSCDIFP